MFNSPERAKFLEPRPENQTEVANWIYFYLRSLIGYAITSIGDALRKKLDHAAIDIQLLMNCVFTTPTTWDANTITTFGFIAERAIQDARQDQNYASSLKIIRVDITEPDAVANYVLHQGIPHLNHGDNFLVVDVGGSTSDYCFCQVAEVYGHHICVISNSEAPIRGITYGCIDIDQTFQSCVMERLSITRVANPSIVAMQMGRSSEFQDWKVKYPTQEHNDSHSSFSIPGLPAVTFQQAQIFRGRMYL